MPRDMIARRLAVLAALAAVAAACTPAQPAGAAPMRPAPSSPVAPGPVQLAATFAALPTYGDGMPSCVIDSGRTVFLTGDATVRAGGPGPHSTVTVLDARGRAHVVRPGYPTTVAASPYQAVPEKETGRMHWLGPCIYDAARRLLFALSPVVEVGTGAGVRVDLVTFRVVPGADPVYAGAYRMPREWAGALWLDPQSQLVYWWGASPQATDGWTGRDVFVARTPLALITNAGSWSYRTAAGTWSKLPDVAAAVMLAPLHGGVDLSFTAWRDASGWHVVSRYGGPWGKTSPVDTFASIFEWTSPDLTRWVGREQARVDERAYLFQLHRGTGTATYSVAGRDSAWVAWSR